MSTDKITLGIVGASTRYGWAKRAHMPAILALPEYDLVAVGTEHQDTADASAEEYGARKAYSDYHDLVNDPDISLVDVSVRAPRHYEIVMAALNAGKDVFCEWPLGANSTQADEMALLAQAKGVHTIVGLQSRFAPGFQYMRDLVRDGYLGDLLSANMTMFLPGLLRPRPERSVWSANKENGAHTLNIATGHALDVFLWCLGEMGDVLSSITTQVPEWEIAESPNKVSVTSPDNVAFLGHLENGAVISVHIATVPWHGTAFRMEAYGTGGTLTATSDQMVEMVDPIIKGGQKDDPKMEILQPPNDLHWVPDNVPPGVPVNVAQLFRRFATAIHDGEHILPDFTEAARLHHTLDKIERSGGAL
jgi:predicted dehydrogenase